MSLVGYECDCVDRCTCFDHLKTNAPIPECDACGGAIRQFDACPKTPSDLRIGHEIEDVMAWVMRTGEWMTLDELKEQIARDDNAIIDARLKAATSVQLGRDSVELSIAYHNGGWEDEDLHREMAATLCEVGVRMQAGVPADIAETILAMCQAIDKGSDSPLFGRVHDVRAWLARVGS